MCVCVCNTTTICCLESHTVRPFESHIARRSGPGSAGAIHQTLHIFPPALIRLHPPLRLLSFLVAIVATKEVQTPKSFFSLSSLCQSNSHLEKGLSGHVFAHTANKLLAGRITLKRRIKSFLIFYQELIDPPILRKVRVLGSVRDKEVPFICILEMFPFSLLSMKILLKMQKKEIVHLKNGRTGAIVQRMQVQMH